MIRTTKKVLFEALMSVSGYLAPIKCEDCICNIKGHCYRFPPMPHFICGQWDVERPHICMDGEGCFAGIPKNVIAIEDSGPLSPAQETQVKKLMAIYQKD